MALNPADAIDGSGTRKGSAGMRIAVETFVAGAAAGATVEVDELEQRGDRVFVQGRVHVKGEASGAEVVGPPVGSIYTFRDGRILRIEWHYDVAKARAVFDQDDELTARQASDYSVDLVGRLANPRAIGEC